jgi:hypothetical protein
VVLGRGTKERGRTGVLGLFLPPERHIRRPSQIQPTLNAWATLHEAPGKIGLPSEPERKRMQAESPLLSLGGAALVTGERWLWLVWEKGGAVAGDAEARSFRCLGRMKRENVSASALAQTRIKATSGKERRGGLIQALRSRSRSEFAVALRAGRRAGLLMRHNRQPRLLHRASRP